MRGIDGYSHLASLALDGQRGRSRGAASPHRPLDRQLRRTRLSYLAIASLIWGIADASMDQPLDLAAFDAAPSGGRTWRIAHLSDIHVVGEQYGFRIESGR